MRIKLQALTEHIHGFLLILGITAFLSCLIFPSHYLFYFFHSFLLLIPFAVTAYGQEMCIRDRQYTVLHPLSEKSTAHDLQDDY